MQKVFVKSIEQNNVSLDQQDIHHLTNVMRLKENSQFIAIHNFKKYLVSIKSINPFNVVIIEELQDNSKNDFILNVFQSNIKPNHIEISIIKACEMNVDNFYIFNSSLSQGNIKHNIDRYLKLIKSASEQSNRCSLMNLIVLNSQNELEEKLNENDINILAHLTIDKNKNLETKLSTNKSIGLIVGPEGGFNEKDLSFFNKFDVEYLHLTNTILRSETALLYLISIISFLKLKG
ncbi:MAG: 16S rRNA (uracil(1498)-N(3))-methyltransferase [Mycoplasma sp.]